MPAGIVRQAYNFAEKCIKNDLKVLIRRFSHDQKRE